MDSRGEKRGVKRDRRVSWTAGSSILPPPKARKIKDQPRVRECGHNRPVFSTESTMLSLESKSCEMCSTGRSKRSKNWVPGMKLESIESTATELSVLLGEDKITLDQAVRAAKKFEDNYGLRILWLKMSLEHQIKCVKDL